MRESYEKMTVLELRRVAKEKGVKLGAGISKQGIIDKLTGDESAPAAAPAPEVQEAPVQPRYTAAIITDDEQDDVPVLTPNSAAFAPRKPVTRPAPAPNPQQPSSLSSISSKAPAFTMEGSRAWHNPLTYQSQPKPQPRPAYGQDRFAQDMRPQQQDNRFGARAPQPRPAYGARPQQGVQGAYQAPNRFGPAETPVQEPYPQQEYTPAADQGYRNDYQPRPQPEFIPPTAPEYSRRDPYAQQPREASMSNAAVMEMLMTGECGDAEGVLELHPEGYGFLRSNTFLPGKNDVYVSNAQIRRFGLRSGDHIEGKTRPQQQGSRYSALLYITKVNGQQADETAQRVSFDQLTAIYPKKRILMGADGDLFLRAVDLLSPIGLGQRALIQAPPRSGRTTLLKKMAAAIGKHYPSVHLMTLLIDERPEDITDIQDTVPGAVIASPCDAPYESHARVADLTLERAQRMVEQKQHVVLFVDSMTKLCRALNALAPQSARALPNGLVPTALARAKRLFGAARNTREGGSLTVIALFQTDTQSALDEAILQEFKNTANMELQLERIPGEKRMLPCMNAHKAATRNEQLMLSQEEMAAAGEIRAALGEAAPRSAQKLIPLLGE